MNKMKLGMIRMIGAALASTTLNKMKVDDAKQLELDEDSKQVINEVVEEVRPSKYNRNGRSRLNNENVSAYQPKPPVPKGCKEYYFNADGTFRHNLLDSPYHWYCVASSDKVAINKFKKVYPGVILEEVKTKLL